MSRSYSWALSAVGLAAASALLAGGMLALAQERDDAKPDENAPQIKNAKAQVEEQAKEEATTPLDDRNANQDEGRTQRPGLGIQFDRQAEGQLTVGEILQGSIAARSGLRAGDRIVSMDGRNVSNPGQFQAYLSGQYGRRVPVIIERNGRQYTVQLQTNDADPNGAWLGVYLQENEEGQTGVRITHVYPAGPAARAGFRPGDVVVSVNGKEVESTPEFISLVESLEPRSKAEFVVQRGEGTVTLPATLGSREMMHFARSELGGGQGEAEGEYGQYEDDEFSNIPPFAMQLEHHRRMAEQHQRLETELVKLQEEVRKLREAIEKK